MPEALIELQNLCVQRAQTILHDISWRVLPKENWVILGANGAGKSTLLNALTAYDSFSGGVIKIAGHTYGEYNWPELRKQIGFVSASLELRLRQGESAQDIILGGRFASLGLYDEPSAEDEKRALEILEKIGCSPLRFRAWGCLSQGEKRRIMIGRALMLDPILLILDEPCSGLDPVARERFLRFLQRLSKVEGAPSLVMTTHHLEDIMPIFTHCLALKNGRVLAAGKISETLNNRLVSELFDTPMTVQQKNGRYQLEIPALDEERNL